MTAAVDTDIDAFIREQKLKLASERQTLHQEDDKLMAKPIHGHWDLDGGKETRFAEQKDSHETSHHQQRVLTPVQDVGLPVGQYQKKRLALDQERRKEYQEYLRQKQVTDKGADNSDNQSSLDLKAVSSELTQKNNNKQIHSGGYEGLTLGGYEKVKARLREERRQDFLNMLASKLERQYQRNTLENLKKQERELREELDKNESQREGTHTQQEASKEMSGLPLGEYEEKRKTYDAQRRQEYSEMREGQERRQREELDNTFGLMGLGVHRQPHPSRRQNDVQGASDQWQTSGTRKGRPDSITGSRAQIDSIGDLLRWDLGPGRVGLTSADLVNQALREERRREYSLQLEQEDQKRRKKMQQREAQHRQDTSFQEGDRQEKWSEEREQEYRRMLTGKSKQEKQQEEEAVQQAGSVTQNHAMDVSRKPFQAAEGRQEFSTTPQSQQNCGFAKERHSGTPSSEGSFLSHLGSRYENERRRLREERQNEYKAMLQEKAVLRREPVDQGIVSEKVGGSAIRPNSSALRERQREERNREYNTMLDQKRKQNDDQKYGSIFKENFEDNFLSSLGSRDVHRK
ncbi:trichohyalin-like isoform X15 [Pomacea canaliculata]|uniref:trichohyalin-like isoform X15 n=1 Tax=Pomacea canaliculata TaxID=400727 RepID=UPI000D73DBEA|nr:trichohyalin-like isoform X15 [Pomacea canaliculata]